MEGLSLDAMVNAWSFAEQVISLSDASKDIKGLPNA